MPLEVISFYVPGLHLVEEERAVRHAHPRRRLHRAAAEVEVDAEHDQAEGDPAPADAEALPRRRGRRRRRVVARGVGGRSDRGHGRTLLRSRTRRRGSVRAWPRRPRVARTTASPSSGRDPDEAHRTATPLELLFDLTFVVAFGIAAERARALRRRGSRLDGHRRLRVRVLRRLLGVDQLLVVRLGLRHRRLGDAPGDDGADARRARAGARARAGVRVDRRRRRARQRRDGGGLRRHARADGVPVGARGAAQPRAAAGGDGLHLDDLGRAGRSGSCSRSSTCRSGRRSRSPPC